MKLNTNTKLILLVHFLITMPGLVKLVRQYLQGAKKKRQFDLLEFLLTKTDVLEELTTEQILLGIAPDGGLSSSAYRNISSQLAILLEESLADFEIRARPYMFKLFVAMAYKKLGLDKQFFKAVRDAMNEYLPKDELQQHLALTEANRMIFFHPNADLHIHEDYQQYLDDWYLNSAAVMAIVSLKYYCISMGRKMINGFPLTEGLEENIKHLVLWLPEQVKELVIVQVYLKAAKAWTTLLIEDYLDFKGFLLANLENLHSEHGELLVQLINILYFLDFPPNSNKEQEKFELYKLGVEKEYFIDEGTMPSQIFNNILYLACVLKKTDWVKDFEASHLKYLRASDKFLENIKHLSASLMAFSSGNFAAAIPTAKKIKNSDLPIAIRKYTLLIKCLYELKHTDKYGDITLYFRNFKEYLGRQDLTDDLKNRLFNFMRLTNLMLEVPYKRSKESLLENLKKLKGKISEEKWLEEKLNELK